MRTTERLDKETVLVTDGELKYIQFDALLKDETGLAHCFTTKKGGVSGGQFSSLNLGYNGQDSKENVRENFERLCRSLSLDPASLVFSWQVHGKQIRVVNREDTGRLYADNGQITGFDGLVTTEGGITLATFHADCIPVMIYERNGKAAACVHSGWRSTLAGISAEAVRTLKESTGASGSDLTCVVGPGIGKCCFEVQEDVYGEFAAKWPDRRFYISCGNGKWKIDLREIIKKTLLDSGIPEDNIHISTICTKCRRDIFFSYRGDGGKTGSLAALMHIRKD